MITQTSESAIRVLVWLALEKSERPVPPHRIAEEIDASPTYMAKVTRMLVKAGILRSWRGAQGGVKLGKAPAEIRLVDVIEACQGLLIGNYCQGIREHHEPTCAFHQAMVEVNDATKEVLARWTIADLAARPRPDGCFAGKLECKMAVVVVGTEGVVSRR